jgi:catechol 2,3-dioxygenase-like lactoylglutathione lyase family enzyme
MIDVFPEATTLPIFPSRDFEKTIAFYDRLGFGVELHVPGAEGYLILSSGPMELHFFPHKQLDPKTSIAGAYIRTDDVDALYNIVSPDEHLPQTGIPRYEPPIDRPWGMREFYIVDEDGSLLKFGQKI